MTGYGSMNPVEKAFITARAMRPELKNVGLVWNAAEANSQAQTKLARKVCSEMGINLLEANAENSSAALEALNSLLSRGVEAVWISGDVTVSLASESIINTCRKARVPVFSSIPPNVNRGALFDLGANYSALGNSLGNLAADVLDGKKNTADVPVENILPEVFFYNDTILPSLKEQWTRSLSFSLIAAIDDDSGDQPTAVGASAASDAARVVAKLVSTMQRTSPEVRGVASRAPPAGER
jgi:ABC-type uncharacterized transport system substrate-binding protein